MKFENGKADWLEENLLDYNNSWNEFDKFEKINSYLVDSGEGDTLANQIATSVSKIIYRYYNDGDIYDNQQPMGSIDVENAMEGLSSYANWLAQHIDGMEQILEQIRFVQNDHDYINILYKMAELAESLIDDYKDSPKEDSVYNCDGEFDIIDYYDTEDTWEDDEDDWGDAICDEEYDEDYDDEYDEDYYEYED